MLRSAVLGVGYIGRRHCEILLQHPQTTLAAVADPDSDRLKGLKDQGVPIYGSLTELLRQSDAEVIHICTPNYLHTLQALEALEAGRHVVIEKPMGLESRACEAVVQKATALQRKVFVVMQNRFTPTAVWLKELLDSRALGRLYMVQVNCFWNRDDRYYHTGGWRGRRELDGGVLYTQFSHFIDILYWLLGPLYIDHRMLKNLAHQHNTDMADSGHVLFSLPGQPTLGSLHFSTAVYQTNLESSITLIGEKGTVRIAGQYMNDLVYCEIEGVKAPSLPTGEPPNQYGAYQGSAANHHYIIQNVVDTLLHGRQPSISGEDGAAVVRLIEEMYRSSGPIHS